MSKKGFLIMNGITWFLVVIAIAEHVPQMIDNLFQAAVVTMGVAYMCLLAYWSFQSACKMTKK